MIADTMELIRGLLAPLQAIPILIKEKSNLAWVLGPLAASILVTLLALYCAVFWLDAVLPVPPIEFEGFSQIGVLLQSFMHTALAFSLRVLLGLALFLMGFSISCSFLYSGLVERVEQQLGIPEKGFEPLPLLAQVMDGLIMGLFMLMGGLLASTLSFLPVIGLPGALFLVTVLNGFLIGSECHDFSLGLRGQGPRSKLCWVFRHRLRVLGTGLVALVFMPIPILNACFLTLSIIGATLNVRSIEDPRSVESTC